MAAALPSHSFKAAASMPISPAAPAHPGQHLQLNVAVVRPELPIRPAFDHRKAGGAEQFWCRARGVGTERRPEALIGALVPIHRVDTAAS